MGREDMTKKTSEIIVGGVTAAVAGLAGAQVAGAAEVSDTSVDWSGVYWGVSAAMQGGDSPMAYDDGYTLGDDVSFGGFIGINDQKGNIVYGGELAIQSGVNADSDDRTSSEYQVDYTADAKFKLGTTLGDDRFLVYGFGGFSAGGFHNQSEDYAFFGLNYGMGAEFMVTDAFTIGIEGLGRSVLDTYGWSGSAQPGAHYQGTLRAAFHF